MKYLIILSLSILFFTSCTKEDKLSDAEIASYITKGKEIGQITVKKLGSNLMKHMKEGGPAQAIPFCNAKASPLTAEVAKKYNVSIKRTSHKIRNENSKPNATEKNIIKKYLAAIENGEKLKPTIKKDNTGKVHFYAPIKLQQKCLACHGTIGKEVTHKTDSILKSMYPNDKATGFKVGDLRGIVNITFNE